MGHIVLQKRGCGEQKLFDSKGNVIIEKTSIFNRAVRFIANITVGISIIPLVEDIKDESSMMCLLSNNMLVIGLMLIMIGCMTEDSCIMVLGKGSGKGILAIWAIFSLVDEIGIGNDIIIVHASYVVFIIVALVGLVDEAFNSAGGIKFVDTVYAVAVGIAFGMCIIAIICQIIEKEFTVSSLVIIDICALFVADFFKVLHMEIEGIKIDIVDDIMQRFGSEKLLEEYREDMKKYEEEERQFEEEMKQIEAEIKDREDTKENKDNNKGDN